MNKVEKSWIFLGVWRVFIGIGIFPGPWKCPRPGCGIWMEFCHGNSRILGEIHGFRSQSGTKLQESSRIWRCLGKISRIWEKSVKKLQDLEKSGKKLQESSRIWEKSGKKLQDLGKIQEEASEKFQELEKSGKKTPGFGEV